MTNEYPEAKPCLDTLIPEELFSYRADLDLARNEAEARAAAARALKEVPRTTVGFSELMAYAIERVTTLKGQ